MLLPGMQLAGWSQSWLNEMHARGPPTEGLSQRLQVGPEEGTAAQPLQCFI